MKYFSAIMPGRGAVDQDNASAPHAGPMERSRQPEMPPHQAIRRARTTRTARTTETKGLESVDVTHNRSPGYDRDESEDPRLPQQAPRYGPRHAMQSDEPARISESSDRAESGPVKQHGSSRNHNRISWNAETSKRSEYRGQGLATASTYIGSHEEGIPGLRQVPGKIDSLMTKTERIEQFITAFEQDKNERLALRKALEDSQDQLREKTMALEETRKRWKKATAQVSQLQSQEQRVPQLSDSDLIASVMELRYSIRSFSVQYFSGQGPKQPSTLPFNSLSKYMQDITGGADGYIDYLMSETQGPVIIQAFLWRLLVGEIFERFCWVPWLQTSMNMICRALDPDVVYNYNDMAGHEAPKGVEADRRFHMWKATTAALVVESLKSVDGKEYRERIENFNSNMSQQILDAIQSFVRGSDEAILVNLRNIIESSIALDKEISKLTARIDWLLPPCESRLLFNPACMEVEIGSVMPRSGQIVDVAIAPMLEKRGKSTGEGFDVGNLLLKMEVACIPSR